MKVRAYWGDLKLGDQEFPYRQVVDTEPTRQVQAALKGGLLQVVQPDRKPMLASVGSSSPSPSPPPSPSTRKAQPTVANKGG